MANAPTCPLHCPGCGAEISDEEANPCACEETHADHEAICERDVGSADQLGFCDACWAAHAVCDTDDECTCSCVAQTPSRAHAFGGGWCDSHGAGCACERCGECRSGGLAAATEWPRCARHPGGG